MEYQKTRTTLTSTTRTRRQYLGVYNPQRWWMTQSGSVSELVPVEARQTISWSRAGSAEGAVSMRDRLSGGQRILSTLAQMGSGVPEKQKLVLSSPCEHTAQRLISGGLKDANDDCHDYRLVKLAGSPSYRVEFRQNGRAVSYDALNAPEHSSSPDLDGLASDISQRVIFASDKVRDTSRALCGPNLGLALVELRDLPRTVVGTVKLACSLGDVAHALETGMSLDQFKRTMRRSGDIDMLRLGRAARIPSHFWKEMGRQSAKQYLGARFGWEPTVRDIERLWIPFTKEYIKSGQTDAIAKELKVPWGATERAGWSCEIMRNSAGPYSQSLDNIGSISCATVYNNNSMASKPVGWATPWSPVQLWGASSTLDKYWEWAARTANVAKAYGVCYGQLIACSSLTKTQRDFIRHTWRWGQLGSIAWNATSFTWLVDWIVNIGTLVSRMERELRMAKLNAMFTEGVWETSKVVMTRLGSVPTQIVVPRVSSAYITSQVTHNRLVSWEPVWEDTTFLRKPVRGQLTANLLDMEVTPFRASIVTALVLSWLR